MSKRPPIFWLSMILPFGLAVLGLIGWLTGNTLIASALPQYIPMAPASAISFLLLMLAFGVQYHQPQRGALVAVPTILVLLISTDILLSVFHLPTIRLEQFFVPSKNYFDRVPVWRMSPISALLFLLSGAGLLLVVSNLKNSRVVAGILASFSFMGLLILLVGYFYDTPILYGETIIPVALTTVLGFMGILTALIFLIGSDHFPFSWFAGEDIQARLLRTFLPLSVLLILVGSAVQLYIRNQFPTNEALITSIVALVSLVPVSIFTLLLSRRISKQLDAAKAEKDRLVSIIEQTSDLVVILDSDQKPLYANGQFLQVFGLTDEPIESIDLKNCYPDWAWSKMQKEVLPLTQKNGIWAGETSIHSGKEGETPVSQVMLYHHGQSANECYYAAIIRDMSEQKAIQKELEQFAYVASHDLQEPLRMVSSFLELLQKRNQNKLDENSQLYIHHAVDGAKRMNALIAGLLEYSRTGRIDNQRRETNLELLLAKVVEGFREELDETGGKVEVSPLPTLRVVPSNMERLFQNLIGNALKYRKNDVSPKIQIQAKQGKGFWQFSIADNGIGIDPKFHEKVFVIFQRLHLRDDYPGTGMGLAICKKIVENHGGVIWVDSKEGKGSTFFFTLPTE